MMPYLLAGLAAMTLFTTPGAYAEDGIALSVTSPDGETAFAGACTITGAEGERTETYDQMTPLNVVFEGARGLRCRLESRGAIEVAATGPGGNVSRTRTSGGTVTLSLGG